jgi:hypothetical protein
MLGKVCKGVGGENEYAPENERERKNGANDRKSNGDGQIL